MIKTTFKTTPYGTLILSYQFAWGSWINYKQKHVSKGEASERKN